MYRFVAWSKHANNMSLQVLTTQIWCCKRTETRIEIRRLQLPKWIHSKRSKNSRFPENHHQNIKSCHHLPSLQITLIDHSRFRVTPRCPASPTPAALAPTFVPTFVAAFGIPAIPPPATALALAVATSLGTWSIVRLGYYKGSPTEKEGEKSKHCTRHSICNAPEHQKVNPWFGYDSLHPGTPAYISFSPLKCPNLPFLKVTHPRFDGQPNLCAGQTLIFYD